MKAEAVGELLCPMCQGKGCEICGGGGVLQIFRDFHGGPPVQDGLLPCPFCDGTEAKVETQRHYQSPTSWQVVCPCGLHGPIADQADDPITNRNEAMGPMLAIRRWNAWDKRPKATNPA